MTHAKFDDNDNSMAVRRNCKSRTLLQFVTLIESPLLSVLRHKQVKKLSDFLTSSSCHSVTRKKTLLEQTLVDRQPLYDGTNICKELGRLI